MNIKIVTLEDCVEMYERKNQVSVIENGEIVCFRSEKKESVANDR